MIVEGPKTTVLRNPSLQGVLTLEVTGNQCSEPGSPTKMFAGTQHIKELGNVIWLNGEQTVTVCRGHKLHFCAKKNFSLNCYCAFPQFQVEHWLQVPN